MDWNWDVTRVRSAYNTKISVVIPEVIIISSGVVLHDMIELIYFYFIIFSQKKKW